MQPKRNLGETAPKPPYLQQTAASGAPGPTRSQHAPPPPTFFGGYPTRGPPPTSSGMPARFSYPPPSRQPPLPPYGVGGSAANDERDPRYDRSGVPQPPPPMTSGYQRPPPPPSSYGYPQPGYPGGPPPRGGDARNSGLPGNGHAGSPSYRPPPPYGGPPPPAPYNIPQQRSQSWGTAPGTANNKGDNRYPEGFHAPYTSAQRNAGEKPDQKEHDASSSGGQFRIVGDVAKKQAYVPYQPRVDVDAMAYKAVEGRDGATSPSQIESNRRDDVSNMGCTCKKSKCLKLYCVCFGASVMCGSNCRCMVCHNTPLHEQSRKDAIRSILARNPNAFDTKFKKTADQRVLLARPLAHKLGCKCRKSFCTKKYCECYNAGVKCSGSCRCINCKNMPPGGFGATPGKDGQAVIAPRSFADGVMRVKKGQKKHPPNSEHKMMHAAQRLAFLKHASPARERRDIKESRQNSTTSMPSLATSSSGASSASPDAEATKKPVESITSGGGVNTLLLAAYAMTELGEAEHREISKSTPATPEKRKAKTFRSPKRRSGNTLSSTISSAMIEDQFADADDAEGADDEIMEASESSNGPTLMTPGDLGRVKRTRVGTVERRPPTASRAVPPFDATPRVEKPTSDSEESEQNNESGEEQDKPSPDQQKDKIVLSTPTAKKTPKTIGDLTPVTARCIDFRHMGVADKDATIDEKKDDSEVATQ